MFSDAANAVLAPLIESSTAMFVVGLTAGGQFVPGTRTASSANRHYAW